MYRSEASMHNSEATTYYCFSRNSSKTAEFLLETSLLLTSSLSHVPLQIMNYIQTPQDPR
jgi:hypothetical protein